MKRRSFFIGIFMFFLIFPVFAWEPIGTYWDIPEPRLVSPVIDEINLKGKASLEFKWMISYFNQVAYYEIRLYKGYNMLASTLFFKQRIPYPTNSLDLETELFENGQIYTWSLIQVASDGLKSARSFSSFKVIK